MDSDHIPFRRMADLSQFTCRPEYLKNACTAAPESRKMQTELSRVPVIIISKSSAYKRHYTFGEMAMSLWASGPMSMAKIEGTVGSLVGPQKWGGCGAATALHP